MGMPRYCTMDDGANELSTNLKGVAEHTDHQAMGPVESVQSAEGACCDTDKSGFGCAVVGCALSIQMLTSSVTTPESLGTRSEASGLRYLALPLAPIFPFLRPPIA